MRKIVLSLVIGGSLLAAALGPAMACPFNTQAANQQQQQTAQAQSSDTKTQ